MFNRSIKCLCFKLKNGYRNFSHKNINTDFLNNKELIKYFMDTFDVPEYRVHSMMVRYPTLHVQDHTQLDNSLNTCLRLGFSKDEILSNPRVLRVHPKTIVNRVNVLKECKVNRLTLKELSKFKTIFRLHSISQLYKRNLLNSSRDLWVDMVECFHYWPDVQYKLLTERIKIDTDKTLMDLRMIILQEFLKLMLDHPMNRFNSFTAIYSPIKSRSFTAIGELLHVLESIDFSKSMIASYGYILLLDPKNVERITKEVPVLGGQNVKQVLEKYPAIMKNNCQDILKIKNLLKENGISEELQQKCYLVFTLKYETILERLNELKTLDNFQCYQNHPRIMSFLYNRRKIGERMQLMKSANKKCYSLHKLAAGQKEFDMYLHNFGDKTGGVDIMYFLSEKFSPLYSHKQLKQRLSIHKFWLHMGIADIVRVVAYLDQEFDIHQLFNNCQILLYPLKNIKSLLEMVRSAQSGDFASLESYVKRTSIDISQVDLSKLSGDQMLSLICYLMEKQIGFTDDGVWEKSNVVETS